MGDERATAAAVAREAGLLLLQQFREGVRVEWKGERDPVTAADQGAESLIRRRLADAYPHDLVVGEEGESPAEADVAGRRRWYVDPLDGTTNFIRGRSRWAVAVAFCDADDRVAAAAIHVPCAGETFTAGAGDGVDRDGEPVRVATTDDLSEALVALGALPRGWRDQRAVAAIAGRIMSLRVTGSSACDLVDVACGRADAFVTTGSGRWDVAAGGLIAGEAGATVTTAEGGAADRPADSVLAAVPGLHPPLLELLERGSEEIPCRC